MPKRDPIICVLVMLQDLGRLKIQPNGIFFKSSKSGEIIQINDADVSNLEWMRVARGYEVKVVSNNGSVTKFDGFKESVSLSWEEPPFIFHEMEHKMYLRLRMLCLHVCYEWEPTLFPLEGLSSFSTCVYTAGCHYLLRTFIAP